MFTSFEVGTYKLNELAPLSKSTKRENQIFMKYDIWNYYKIITQYSTNNRNF